MRLHDVRPVVVVGLGHQGLGVLRSLSLARLPIYALDTDYWKSLGSRCGKFVRIRATSGRTLVDDLLCLANTIKERPVLILTHDIQTETVSCYRDILLDAYDFLLPSRSTYDALSTKLGFQRFAEAEGFPVPRSVFLSEEQDVEKLRMLSYPCIFKPNQKSSGYAKLFRKAYKVNSPAEAEALYRSILELEPTAIVQEWIAGSDSDIFFCLQFRGKPDQATASFVGRKIRSWPPRVGNTSSCVAAPEARAELESLTNAFFERAEVVGICSMEFKRNSANGKFLMVEPTIGRTNFQIEIATLNGVNIPLSAYSFHAGPVDWAKYDGKRQAGWRTALQDVASSALSGNRNKFPDGTRVYDSLWRWDDPVPAVFGVGTMAFYAFRRLRRFAKSSMRNAFGKRWP